MGMTTCPDCKSQVSDSALDCPSCGRALRKLKRGFFGILAKWAFILWNILMIAWLVSYFGGLGDLMNRGNEYERAGAAIGATIGTGFVMTVWMVGAVITGLFALLTRPSR